MQQQVDLVSEEAGAPAATEVTVASELDQTVNQQLEQGIKEEIYFHEGDAINPE